MICIGLSIVALTYIAAIIALRHAPFPESHGLGCHADLVRTGKPSAGSVHLLSEPAINLPGCQVEAKPQRVANRVQPCHRAVEAEGGDGIEGVKPSTPTNL